MGLVTGLAGHPVRGLVGDHLWERLRPGRTGRVAPYAEYCRIQLGRRHRRVGGMRRLRSMARFAVHVLVPAFVFQFGFVGVACFASVMPCIFGWLCCDLCHGRGTVVTVLPECFGTMYPRIPQNNKNAITKRPANRRRCPASLNGFILTNLPEAQHVQAHRLM